MRRYVSKPRHYLNGAAGVSVVADSKGRCREAIPAIPVVIAGLCMSAGAWATATYTVAMGPFSFGVGNFVPPCGTGPCANYAATTAITGKFATSIPLAGNLIDIDIAPIVTTYSFSDGINTYSSANQNCKVVIFNVATSADGTIRGFNVILQLWQTGSSPHQRGDRIARLEMSFQEVSLINNDYCRVLSVVPDTCDGLSGDVSSSNAFTPFRSPLQAPLWAPGSELSTRGRFPRLRIRPWPRSRSCWRPLAGSPFVAAPSNESRE